MKNAFAVAMAFWFSLSFVSCPTEGGNGGGTEPAIVRFVNYSSYKVDVYKNLNPENFDPTTLVASLNSGATQEVKQYPSFDSLIGDAFYPRYKILLADMFETGTNDIFVDAQRVLSNMTFVIESGKSYTKMIPQPEKGELSFFHGYISVHNQGSSQIQIINGSTILHRLDNNAVNINPLSFGFYEIQFSPFDDELTMNWLKAFSSQDVPFPAFTMEKGKLYQFTFDGSTVSEPKIENIDPVGSR